MRYLTARRFKRQGIGGNFNLGYGTVLEKRDDGILYFEDRKVCVARSAASHLHFVSDFDGNGLKRYYWTSNIIKRLDGNNREKSPMWESVMDDKIAQGYRRVEHEDYWLWDDKFYNESSIEDLEHIGSLIGIKDGDN